MQVHRCVIVISSKVWSVCPKKRRSLCSRSWQSSKYNAVVTLCRLCLHVFSSLEIVRKSCLFFLPLYLGNFLIVSFYFSIGDNVKYLIDRPDSTYCFREKKDRVYYVSEKILALANTVAPENLMSVGTCIGKFTKTGKFRLHITALHYLAPYAKVTFLPLCSQQISWPAYQNKFDLFQHKLWVKSSAEQQFLYGNNVNKAGLGRITENTTKYQGVVVYSMNDLPLVRIW